MSSLPAAQCPGSDCGGHKSTIRLAISTRPWKPLEKWASCITVSKQNIYLEKEGSAGSALHQELGCERFLLLSFRAVEEMRLETGPHGDAQAHGRRRRWLILPVLHMTTPQEFFPPTANRSPRMGGVAVATARWQQRRRSLRAAAAEKRTEGEQQKNTD